VVSLRGDQTLGELRAWIAEGGSGSTHHGFPGSQTEGPILITEQWPGVAKGKRKREITLLDERRIA
jgi:hypothetical protein